MTEIKKKGNPILSQVSKEAVRGEDVYRLRNLMFEVMYGNKGIGLAAVQIGELKRMIVLHVNGLKMCIVNPVITKRYGGKGTSKEGCLSYPGLLVSKIRDKQIIVEGYDESWNPIKRKLKGLAAYCVQHEVDHLDGITII